jgi:Peptidase family M28/PDZ domain/PA domain
MQHRGQLKDYRCSLLVGLTLALILLVAPTSLPVELAAQAPNTTDELERHVRYLASKTLTGRGVDTPGITLARDYIAGEFARYGLKPGATNGSYFQSFDVAVGVKVLPPTSLRLGIAPALSLNEDWVPLGLSASDRVEAELVFAGYGITAKKYGYDDYESIDAKGKVVLVLRYEPPPKDKDSPFKKYPDYSSYSALRTKANNARAHGARAMILVDLNRSGNANDELLSTNRNLWRGGRSLIAAQIKRDPIEKALASRGVSLAELKSRIDRSEKPASQDLPGMTVALQVKLAQTLVQADNVVAILPGSRASSGGEYIVIGAHYDHLGMGYFGAIDGAAAGTIHPGADDNASGTAVLLTLARRLAQLPVTPARTIIFVAFSGEELGLFGSRHFVEASPLIASTKAMLNLDMVGRMRGARLTVFGTRSGENFSNIVKATAKQLDLEVTESDDVGRSDHQSFYSKKIPVLHFFTGNHEDYHRATDTWDKLNIDGMAQVSDLVMLTALQIADAEKPLGFVSLPSRPPGRVRAAGQALATYLGSIPEYGTQADGVVLAGVAEGSPAALAGLRQGDVIIALANRKILTVEDLTDALQGKKAGDEVEITVLRVGKTLTLKATLRDRS